MSFFGLVMGYSASLPHAELDGKGPMALMIKESVNETVDNQGFYNSLNACFTIHQLNHAHWAEIHEDGWPAAKPEDGVPLWQEAQPIVPAERHTVRAADPA